MPSRSPKSAVVAAADSGPRRSIETHVVCSVPVFSSVLDEFDEKRRRSFVRMVLDLKDGSPGLQVSNRNGWHSERNLHTSGDENMLWFHRQIQPFLRASLNTVLPEYRTADIVMTSCWANVGEFKAWNEPHSHFPSHWSGVFYVTAEEALNQEDPNDKSGCIEFMNPIPLGTSYGLHSSHTLRPRNGLALLFPAYLMHYVHPNFTDAVRISLAFNLDLHFGAAPAQEAPAA